MMEMWMTEDEKHFMFIHLITIMSCSSSIYVLIWFVVDEYEKGYFGIRALYYYHRTA